MFHFQTSQRSRSDVDPCYLWNKEKKDHSDSELPWSLQARTTQKPRFRRNPALPKRDGSARQRIQRMDLLGSITSIVETPKSWKMDCYASEAFQVLCSFLYFSSRRPIRRQNKPPHPPGTPPGVCQANPSQVWWHLNCFRSLVFCEVVVSWASRVSPVKTSPGSAEPAKQPWDMCRAPGLAQGAKNASSKQRC